MDSSASDEESWSTVASSDLHDSDDSDLECSTCSSSDDEDCSYKRAEAAPDEPPTVDEKPKFVREDFVLKDKIENDLEEIFGECPCDGPEEPSGFSSSSCSSGSEEEDSPKEKWTSTDTRRTFPFTAIPIINTGAAETPLDFFRLLFSPDFIQFLVDTINARGTELAQKNKKEYLPTDVDEVYTLICTHFMMGYTSCIVTDLLFGHRPSLNVDFNTYLRKERYLMLFTLLSYRVLNSEVPEHYRSWYDVAKPIADKFNQVMKEIMVPGKYLNVAKETALFFNDKNEIVKIPERVRMHLLSDDNGIFQRIILVDPELQEVMRGETIMRQLMEDFFDAGRSLCTPNLFYVTVPLAEEFLKRKTYLSGVLKKNRPRNPTFLKIKPNKIKLPMRVHKMELPPEIAKRVKDANTTIIHAFNEKGVCVCRMISRQMKINVLSTEYNTKPVADQSWECEMIEQISVHTNMKKRNRLLSKSGPCMQRMSNRQVVYILQAMCINAYLLYKVKTGKKMKFVDFLEEILYQMLPLVKEKETENSETPQQRRPGGGRSRREGRDDCAVI